MRARFRLGLVADPHLTPVRDESPSVLGFPVSPPEEYAMSGMWARYRRALGRCVREDVDGVALLGDLSWSGDGASLDAGLRLAARTGRPVWAVSGNHDCGHRVGALARAVRRVGAENVRLATPTGEEVGGGLRIAGHLVTSENRGYTAGSDQRPDVLGWGDEPVVWLAHYPMISFREKAEEAGLYYGDNDLDNLEWVARPLLDRPAPTVVANGHMHMRDASAAGRVLQISCAALVELPSDVTILDLDLEDGRLSVRVKHLPGAPPSEEADLRILSPPEQEWVFEAGTWRLLEPAKWQGVVSSE